MKGRSIIRLLIWPLMAEGEHRVGDVSIRVKDGSLAVAYTLHGDRTEVLKERLQIFVPGSVITAKKLDSNRQGRKLNQPISIQRSLKGAEFALVFLRLDGIYHEEDLDSAFLGEANGIADEEQQHEALFRKIRAEFVFE